ncbi:unnamed protein product [Parajaminaea phylloscopi]
MRRQRSRGGRALADPDPPARKHDEDPERARTARTQGSAPPAFTPYLAISGGNEGAPTNRMTGTSEVGLGPKRRLNSRSAIQLLRDIVESPQFWEGIKVFGIGAAIAASKWLFDVALGFVKSLVLSRAVLRGNDEPYQWAMHYITQHNNSWDNAREVEVSTRARLASYGSGPDVEEDPAHSDDSRLKGVHLYPVESASIHFTFKGVHVFATRVRSLVGESSFEETLNLSFLTLSASTIRDFISTARHAYEASERGRITVYMIDRYGYWSRSRTITRRLRDSIYLPSDAKERVLSDASAFMSDGSRIWYGDRGIPYRRGYLFYGVPGSGKTSLAHVLASELERSIYQITLSGPGITDAKFAELMASVPSGAVVVLEDIDCAFANREPAASGATAPSSNVGAAAVPLRRAFDEPDSGASTPGGAVSSSSVSLSGLLNAVDGISAGEARILVMTTNHRNRLDEALIRPGRIDLQLEFHHATKEQARDLFVRWFAPSRTGGTPPPSNSLTPQQSPPAPSLTEKSADGTTSPSEATGEAYLAEVSQAADRFASATPPDTYSVAALQGFLLTCRGEASHPANIANLWELEVKRKTDGDRKV